MDKTKRKRADGGGITHNGAVKKPRTTQSEAGKNKPQSALDAARQRAVEKKKAEAENTARPSKTSATKINGTNPRTNPQISRTVPQEDSTDGEEDEENSEDEDVDSADKLLGEDEPPLDEQDPSVEEKSFQDLGVIDPLCEACVSMGFKRPTPIQAGAIPPALEGRDIIGLAETGSGKTAAFALPILQALMETPQSHFALVLAPTRELAVQIKDQFAALGAIIAVKTAVIVGGMDMVSQQIALAKNPHIIVATPGRLLDHLQNTKGFSLRKTKYLVMDEADRLLDDADFAREMEKILAAIPRETRKTYLFSATISSKVQTLQRASLKNPVLISTVDKALDGSTSTKLQTVRNLVQSFMFVPLKFKNEWLVALLSSPIHRNHTAIIFIRTHQDVTRVTYILRALGIQAIPLHGGLSQSQRLSSLNRFKQKMSNILVATDVAARGLDVPSVDLVLNYDLPDTDATYVHRVGRTARAGKSGKAISFVTQHDIETWLRIEHALGKKIDKDESLSKSDVAVFSETVDEASAESAPLS